MVIIIYYIKGSGLAGLSAGISLLNQNENVKIIEKKNKIASKVSDDCISNKAYSLLKKLEIELDYCQRYKVIVLFYKSDFIGLSRIKPIYFINKNELNSKLLKRYKKLGGEIEFNTKNTIETYDYIATGYKSNVLNNQAFIVRASLNKMVNMPKIYINYLDKGYAWIFPTKNGGNYGVTGVANNDLDMMKSFKSFSSYLGIDYTKVNSELKYLPDSVSKPIKKNILGSNGGLINPITRKGIYYDLLSGTSLGEENKNIVKKIKNDKFIRDIFYNMSYISSKVIKNKKIRKLVINKVL